MTFSVIGRCAKTGSLGICLSTGSVAVASRVPHITPGLAAVATQSHTNPHLGVKALALLETGLSPETVLKTLQEDDPWQEYRQIGIVPQHGKPIVFTGGECGQIANQFCGEDFICMGNGMASPEFLDAMVQSYLGSSAQPLWERLLGSIEAGCSAGGGRKGQLSAGLIVYHPDSEVPLVDLNVDLATQLPADGGDAVRDLQRVAQSYFPFVDYYHDYWPNHPAVRQNEWLENKA